MSPQLGTVAPVGFSEFASAGWLEAMKCLGCSTAQAYRNRCGAGDGSPGPINAGQIREYLSSGGLPCDSLHGIYGNDVDPSALDEDLRIRAVESFMEEGRMAVSLGGPLVVVHCAGICDNPPAAQQQETRWNQLRKSMAALSDFGEAHGIHYAFENLPPYHYIGSDITRLSQLIAEFPRSSVGMCFDVAHANMAGDPVRAAAEAGNLITYVHICDNDGKADSHLMPQEGNIDFRAVAAKLNEAGYTGVVMLETFCSTEKLEKLAREGFADKLAEIIDIVKG